MEKINNVISQLIESKNLGLQNGLMGMCVGLCINNNMDPIISTSMDYIYSNIESIKKNISIANGLMGIAFGIDFLIKHNACDGNLDRILSDIDDIIYKQCEKIDYNDIQTVYEVLAYIYMRLGDGLLEKSGRKIFELLAIELIEGIYRQKENHMFIEPIPYRATYYLSWFLILTSIYHKVGIYTKRIRMIWTEIKPLVHSIIPCLNANKLWMMFAVKLVYSENKEANWLNYHNLLADSIISIDSIISHEFLDKQIFFTDGIAGIYLLCHYYNSIKGNTLTFSNELFKRRLYSSTIWDTFGEKDTRFGLDGLLGILVLLNKL